MTHPAPTIVILAGQRLGKIDPLAHAHGVEHKCLVPLLGRPLIAYVLDAVNAAYPHSPIVVSINDPRALDNEAEVQPYIRSGRLRTVASEQKLLDSLIVAAQGSDYPLLVTTGDNVLMTPDALQSIHDFATDQAADGAGMFARKQDVLAAHSEGQPRFWKFRDDEFSGCNTFWLRDAGAFSVAEIFRSGGQFLKFPRRFISAFGLANLIGFRLGLFTSQRLVQRISQRFGKKIVFQIADSGELAIDVDNQFSYDVAERLLKKRAA